MSHRTQSYPVLYSGRPTDKKHRVGAAKRGVEMASIRKQGDVFEIRECLSTSMGPRQRALVRFRKVLTPADLDRAQAIARRPFDRDELIRRARARGIPVGSAPRHDEARRLLAHLRDGGTIEPALAKLLVDALIAFASEASSKAQPKQVLPDHLEDVVDWVGRSEAVRGRALRGLLRTGSRVARSRGVLRSKADEPFPRFSSGAGFE